MDVFGYKLSSADLWLLRIAGAVFLVLLGSLVYRANTKRIAKDKSHAQDVANCLAPFEDAISDIHLGEANHIFIMNSFFKAQEESIAVFKTKVTGQNILRLQEAWNTYEQHYTLNARGRIYGQFATIPEPLKTNELNLLHKHLSKIIEAVKKNLIITVLGEILPVDFIASQSHLNRSNYHLLM